MRMALRRAVGRDSRSRHQERALLQAARRPEIPGHRGRFPLSKTSGGVLILDCGSQFTQLIARRVREARVYCEIHPPTRSLQWIREWKPAGIILSGGPSSVTDPGAPTFDPGIL